MVAKSALAALSARIPSFPPPPPSPPYTFPFPSATSQPWSVRSLRCLAPSWLALLLVRVVLASYFPSPTCLSASAATTSLTARHLALLARQTIGTDDIPTQVSLTRLLALSSPLLTPLQCQDECGSILNTLQTCADTDCLCTQDNGDSLEACLGCLVALAPSSDLYDQSQSILDCAYIYLLPIQSFFYSSPPSSDPPCSLDLFSHLFIYPLASHPLGLAPLRPI